MSKVSPYAESEIEAINLHVDASNSSVRCLSLTDSDLRVSYISGSPTFPLFGYSDKRDAYPADMLNGPSYLLCANVNAIFKKNF